MLALLVGLLGAMAGTAAVIMLLAARAGIGGDALRRPIPILFMLTGGSWGVLAGDELVTRSLVVAFGGAFNPIGLLGLISFPVLVLAGGFAGFRLGRWLVDWLDRL